MDNEIFYTKLINYLPQTNETWIGCTLVIKDEGIEKEQRFIETIKRPYNSTDLQMLMLIANSISRIIKSITRIINLKIADIPNSETGYCDKVKFDTWRLEKLFIFGEE